MNANDVRLYELMEQYCKELKITIELYGESFVLKSQRGGTLGSFLSLRDMSNYIYGYQAGSSLGRRRQFKYF